MIKLGTPVTDTATGLKGMLIHMQVQPNDHRFYNFQPRGLDNETGQPLKRFWVTPERIAGGVEVPDLNLYLEVLGTEVEDIASGFRGTAVATMLHINGCVHVSVQPKGVQQKTGQAIEENNFDIRLLSGPAIVPMSSQDREASEKANPSPAGAAWHKPAAL